MAEETNDKLAIPTFIRRWRKFRGINQARLGELTGVTGSSISQLERGLQGFTDKSLARLAEALQCDPVDLLGWDPYQKDSFWPLFRAAESLQGAERERAYMIIAAAVAPLGPESE